MTLEKLGERSLIREIEKILGNPGDHTIVGIGDDAAILRAGDRPLVMTTDSFAEWVHFRTDHISPDQLGAKVMAATVSDCAAMGCIPKWVTVSVAAPEETEVELILSFYHGIRSAADRYKCDVVGGDTIRTMSDMMFTLTAVGEAVGPHILTRSGAKVGDDLFVTGMLGGPGAALVLLDKDPKLSLDKKYREAMERYLAPEARVDVTRILAEKFPITSMIDISDGLATEVHHIGRESGVGIHVESGTVPVLPAALEVAADLDVPIEALIFHGGEEFELLFTAPPGLDEEIVEAVSMEIPVAVTRIGTIVPAEEEIMLVHPEGGIELLTEDGYEHFGKDKK